MSYTIFFLCWFWSCMSEEGWKMISLLVSIPASLSSNVWAVRVIYPNINLLISARCNHLCCSLLPCFVQEQIKYFPKNLFPCCLSPGRNSWCFSYWSQVLCSFSIFLYQSDFVLKCAHCPVPGPFSAEVFLCQVFPPKYLNFTTKLRKLIENTFQIDLPLCWSCIRQVWTLVPISSPYENTHSPNLFVLSILKCRSCPCLYSWVLNMNWCVCHHVVFSEHQ